VFLHKNYNFEYKFKDIFVKICSIILLENITTNTAPILVASFVYKFIPEVRILNKSKLNNISSTAK
jgi:hypothetical protein